MGSRQVTFQSTTNPLTTNGEEMKQRSAGKPDIEMGKKIRLRRVEQRISQSDLGEKLGVSFQQVQKYEKGVNRVGAARLQQIANGARRAGDVLLRQRQQDPGSRGAFCSSTAPSASVCCGPTAASRARRCKTCQMVTLMEAIADDAASSLARNVISRQTSGIGPPGAAPEHLALTGVSHIGLRLHARLRLLGHVRLRLKTRACLRVARPRRCRGLPAYRKACEW